MNSHLTRHSGQFQILTASAVLFCFLLLAFGLAASSSVAQESEKAATVESTLEKPGVLDLLIDVSLGLISEKEFKARLTAAGITDFKAEDLRKTLKNLRGSSRISSGQY